MNFASNSVFGKTPKFVYLGLLRAHTADKMKSIFAPATRAVGLVDNSDCLTSKHRIAEHTVDKVSEEKVYSDYIKNSEFETLYIFDRVIIMGSTNQFWDSTN